MKWGKTMQEHIGKKLTIDDIAKELGVSKTTVSRVMSGKGRIGEKTKRRVQEYIEEHNYKPSAVAQGLAKSRTNNIGLLLPWDLVSDEMSFFPRTLSGISEVAAEEDYDVILTMAGDADHSRLERVLENQKVDGVILMRTLFNDTPVQMLKQSDIPFVTIGLSDKAEVCQIDNDHVGACRELTSILLMKGLKKIAIVAGDMNFIINRERLDGFRRAHWDMMGVLPDRALVYTDMTSIMMIDRAVDALLMQEVNCIIGADDLIAGRIVEKLQEEDICIPEEMRVASFFDSRYLASGFGVTSLKFDVAELGRETCRMLLRRMQGETVPYVTRLPYEVVLRGSTR